MPLLTAGNCKPYTMHKTALICSEIFYTNKVSAVLSRSCARHTLSLDEKLTGKMRSVCVASHHGHQSNQVVPLLWKNSKCTFAYFCDSAKYLIKCFQAGVAALEYTLWFCHWPQSYLSTTAISSSKWDLEQCMTTSSIQMLSTTVAITDIIYTAPPTAADGILHS